MTKTQTAVVALGATAVMLSAVGGVKLGETHLRSHVSAEGAAPAPDPSKSPRSESKEAASELAAKPEERVARIISEMLKIVENRGPNGDDPRSFNQGRALALQLEIGDMDDAIGRLEGMDQKAKEMLGSLLYWRWAELDGRAASEAVLGELDGPALERTLGGVVGTWAEREPREAWLWYGSALEKVDTLSMRGRKYMLGSIFRQWVKADREGALAEFSRSLSFDEQKNVAMMLGADGEDPREILEKHGRGQE